MGGGQDGDLGMNIHHIITRYGNKIDFLNPDPREIDIRDICVALSRLARFNGHTIEPYYVAQHVCLAADLVEDQSFAREAFAHDWAESFESDVNSPLKSLLPCYRKIEKKLERAISLKFGLVYPWPAAVKEIDQRLFVTEVRCLTQHSYWKEMSSKPLGGLKIKPWTSDKCQKEFMKRFRALFA